MTSARPDSTQPLKLSSSHVMEGLTHLHNPDPLTLALQEHLSSPIDTSALMNHFVLEPVETSVDVVEPRREEEPELVHLQAATRLSKSMLWQIQEDYYARQGIDAWMNVPFFVTNSAYIAEAYADMIRNFLLDSFDTLNLEEPVYIVEMATGTGRFSYYLMKELAQKISMTPRLRDVKWRYIMTDFTEKNIEFWEKHEKFQPFIEEGRLDFAIFRPEKFQTLNLRVSNTVLTGKQVKNPMFALANYFFDTIRQDMFRVTNHELQEGKIFLYKKVDRENPSAPLHFAQLEPGWVYDRIDKAYDDPHLNRILHEYRDELEMGSVIFPIGAFDCIRNLQALSNNNLVLISSDKGFTDMDYLHGQRDPHVALHDGAFSFMVNYNAICRYFKVTGGQAFFTSDKTLSIQTVMCVQRAEDRTFDHTEYMFYDRLERQNQVNFLCAVPELIGQLKQEENAKVRFNSMMGFIRMSLCDPSIFCQCAHFMLPALHELSLDQQIDLQRIMLTTWRNYYHFPGEVNLPFWMAQVFLGIGHYEECVFMVEKTVEYFGPHEALDFLKGKAFEGLRDPDAAATSYLCALEKNPDFSEARDCYERLRNRTS